MPAGGLNVEKSVFLCFFNRRDNVEGFPGVVLMCDIAAEGAFYNLSPRLSLLPLLWSVSVPLYGAGRGPAVSAVVCQ